MPIKMSPLFIAALVIMIAITNVVQNCNHYKLSKRITELEEWWSAHHQAIGDTARLKSFITDESDGGTAQRWDSAIVLQPGESVTFTDTLIPNKTLLMEKWRKSFKLYPDTASVIYYHEPMDGEIIRIREEVLYVYSNGHWSKIEVKQ